MTEIILGAPRAYDIFHPTPISLKQLSAISLSVAIWRRYNQKKYLWEAFNPYILNISSKSLIPNLSSRIYNMIDAYIVRFELSMDHWLRYHYRRVLPSHRYTHINDVLLNFDDFVCDFNGEIDYARTAERMMRSDQFNSDEKFVIACTYFFEDDITRLWPLVRENMINLDIDFSKNPQLYYWIYRLTDRLDKIPLFRWRNVLEDMGMTSRCWWNDPIDEVMFDRCLPFNRPSVEYFWNRIQAENRTRKAIDLFTYNEDSFVRFILPKLDDEQIATFITEKGDELKHALLRYDWTHSHAEELRRRQRCWRETRIALRRTLDNIKKWKRIKLAIAPFVGLALIQLVISTTEYFEFGDYYRQFNRSFILSKFGYTNEAE